MHTTGNNSSYKLITGAKAYSIKNIIKDIKTPTLVLDAEKDDSFPGQPKKVYDGLVSNWVTPIPKRIPNRFMNYFIGLIERIFLNKT
jgi:hypothetical protein